MKQLTIMNHQRHTTMTRYPRCRTVDIRRRRCRVPVGRGYNATAVIRQQGSRKNATATSAYIQSANYAAYY